VWDVTPSLSATVDWYQIELRDRVQNIPDATIFEREADCRLGRDRAGNPVNTASAECDFYLNVAVERPVIDSNPLGRITRFRSFPINAALMKTSGVDASLRYQQDIGSWGTMGVQLGYTHVFSFETADFADSPLEDSRNDRQYNQARHRANMRLNWAYGEWNTSLYGHRQGGIPNLNQVTHPGRGPAHTLWNLDVSKQITEQMRMGLSAINVFDKMPPYDESYTSWPYFSPRAYNPIGRQVFFNVTYDF
jgi:iron complex outermembrane receptor protein